MKPTHKLNGGDKATLCKVCRTIIDRDFTDHLLCPNCQTEAINLVKEVKNSDTWIKGLYSIDISTNTKIEELLNELENENI